MDRMDAGAPGRTWPSLALTALGLALIAAAVLGPLILGIIEWRVSPNGLTQTYGADGAALVLLGPASLVAAWLWWRGHPVAAPLAFGVGLAALYYAVASVLGADYVQYEGNNERFFLLFLAIVVLAWTGAAVGWRAMDPDPPRPGRTTTRILRLRNAGQKDITVDDFDLTDPFSETYEGGTLAPNQSVDVVVTSVLQTQSGKMIFAKTAKE